MSKTAQPTFQKETVIIDNNPKKSDNCCCYYIKCQCMCNQSDKRCCMKNLSEYAGSPYCITTYSNFSPEKDDPCCLICMTCTFCLPKQAIFFSCLGGAIINGCINYCKKTEKNYLC